MVKWYQKDWRLVCALRQIENAEWESEQEKTPTGNEILQKTRIARENLNYLHQEWIDYANKTQDEKIEAREAQQEREMQKHY